MKTYYDKDTNKDLIKNEFTLTELQDAFLSLDLENKQFTEKRNFRKCRFYYLYPWTRRSRYWI